MKPGRKLDAIIAAKVMNHILFSERELVQGHKPIIDHKTYNTDIPYYSTDISAAWDVVEKMRENKEWSFFIGLHNQFQKLGFTNSTEDASVDITDGVPHAVCKSALKALWIKL